MSTNYAPLIADLFLYWYDSNFILNLQKSKQFGPIDKINDTSRYLDDMPTIDSPDFAKHIPFYIQDNFRWIKEIFGTIKIFSWI